MADNVEVAQRIKLLREQNGLSQAELAKALNITRSSVNSWEQASSSPSISTLPALCKLLGVSIGWLLGEENQQTIDVSGLSDNQVAALVHVAKEFLAQNGENC